MVNTEAGLMGALNDVGGLLKQNNSMILGPDPCFTET